MKLRHHLALLVAVAWLTTLACGQTATPHGITLKWNAVTTDANGNPLPTGTVVTYLVWRATSASGPFTQITPTPISATSYLDPAAGLTLGQAYTYEVQAVDTGGDGNPSASATATAPSGGFPIDPGAPTGLSASPV